MPHPYQLARDQRSGAPRASRELSAESKIFWNDDEKRKVAKESFLILNRNANLTNMEAIDAAQRKVLRPDRQRPLGSVNFSKFRPWINPMWDEIGGTQEKQAEAKKNLGELFQPESTPMAAEAQHVTPPAPPAFPPDHPAPPTNLTVVGSTTPSETNEAGRKQTVHWRDDEKRTIAARVHYLTRHYHDMRPLEAVRKAVDTELPVERSRDITTWAQVEQWLDPMLAQLKIDEQLAELQAKEQREQERREQAEREALAQAEAERIEAEVQERVEAAIQQRLAAIQPSGLEAIIGLFAQRFADTFVNATSVAVSKAVAQHIGNLTFGQPTKHEEKLVTPSKTRLPKLCVVGLLNQQAEDVQKAFLGTAEFVFVKSHEEGGGGHGGPGMLTKSASCDMVIAMVDHMGRDVEASAKHLKVPYHRLNGSASALKRFITAWLAGEYSAGVSQ